MATNFSTYAFRHSSQFITKINASKGMQAARAKQDFTGVVKNSNCNPTSVPNLSRFYGTHHAECVLRLDALCNGLKATGAIP